MNSLHNVILLLLAVTASFAHAQQHAPSSGALAPWLPDNGDGTYTNPIIHADYSDPDVIRVGDDYYMTSSSFSHFPGLPILHSRDLVNWTIIGHAVHEYPSPEFRVPQHGMGIWAPSLRYRNGEFLIYFGDPDRGIFMTRASDPSGPWAPLRLIRKVTGWIDPCPLWDDDGNAYLVHAFANSRVGIKSILAVNRMNPDGTQVLDDGRIVFVGHESQPTIEGPKFHKRNGYYYIFAPAGGVSAGWQTVLRSRNIFGPYEYRNVLAQGRTRVNGPHQGAWVEDGNAGHWFVHFQDRSAYGRIVHLQPMRWEDDWPVIGVNQDSAGCGEPVLRWRKPPGGSAHLITAPQTSDGFETLSLGLQWQWQAQEQADWYSLTERQGWLRLYMGAPEAHSNVYNAPELLLQKLPAPSCVMTTKVDAKGMQPGDRSGLVVFGRDYASLAVSHSPDGHVIVRSTCAGADEGTPEVLLATAPMEGLTVWLRVEVRLESDTASVPMVVCTFSWSTDGKQFRVLGADFVARKGVWVGAKAGLFAVASRRNTPRGFADYDWFAVEPHPPRR